MAYSNSDTKIEENFTSLSEKKIAKKRENV